MQTNYLYKSLSFSLLLLSVAVLNSCKKFLEPDYKTQVATTDVFASDGNAVAAITGLYANMTTANTNFNGLITEAAGFSSDELKYYQSDVVKDQFQQDSVLPINSQLLSFWNVIYSNIYQCNAIIENAAASTGMSAAYKKQIIGEAKFFREFGHFYLVNLFGPVPLITSTAKDKTAYAARSTVQDVYTQIKSDLTDAYNTLPADYSVSSSKRIRANKWAAAALLARADLYTSDYVNAEAMASAVLANSSLYSLQSDFSKVFLKSNSESILEFERAISNNTYEGSMFMSYVGYYGWGDHLILPGLVSSFETGDLRATKWIYTASNGSVPYKYKNPSTNIEDYLLLRVAEQYLIRAEARAQQNNISAAQTDINTIRNRAGLANDTTMVDKTTAMAAIENERRHELFCEWGHRWFDLKRWPSLTTTGKTRADDVLGALRTGWKSTAIIYPIPLDALNNNPNLTQNAGY